MALAVETKSVLLTASMVQAFAAVPVPAGHTLRLLTAQAVPPDTFTAWCRTMHQVLAEDNALAALFWWQQGIPDTQKGNLADFLAFCRGSLVILLGAPGASGGTRIMGMGWLTDIIAGVQAHIGVWYATAYRQHHNPTAITRAVIGWVLRDLDVPTLWAQSIHPGARQHLLECGGEQWAVIPDYAYFQGKRHPVTLMRIRRDLWAPYEKEE